MCSRSGIFRFTYRQGLINPAGLVAKSLRAMLRVIEVADLFPAIHRPTLGNCRDEAIVLSYSVT
jgi:hypothetical protein